jgi:hypothetical protein
MIWELWRQHKMSDADAREQFILSRAQGAERFVRMVDFHAQQENALLISRIVDKHRESVEVTLGRFRTHPLIDVFMSQFDPKQSAGAQQLRMKALLLRGESGCGKTRMAVSLFGTLYTFTTNAQGMAPDLPSIEAFDRDQHTAIVWDEIIESQVLSNKLVFQSGVEKVTLQQSKCNAHSYTKWLFRVPQILCSNTFSMTGQPGNPLSPEDAEWLAKNIIEVQLPPGQKWFLEEAPE